MAFDNIKTYIIALGVSIGIPLLVARGCTMLFNNKQIVNPAYKTVSYATGLNGHIEYTRYSDGSQDVKSYPGVGHRMWDSELQQDLDGDGLIDRIRRNGAEWKANSLREILVRTTDYQANKGRFDKADKRLQLLMEKYSN